MKKLLLIIVAFYFISFAMGQDVLINEFMSKNSSTIQDKDGEYSDWIELYNPTNDPIHLFNYRLSDNITNLNKWTFPATTILPHDFLLVFASGKNRLDSTELHTNFKISSSGEQLFLSNNFGELIDETNAITLFTDQSYGRVPDGSGNWVIINTPSPTSSNNSSNQLTFSHQEGFYTSPFVLKISSLLSDTVYCTLNGDIPTEQSNVFNDSLIIDFRNADSNVFSEFPTTPDQSLISYKAWEPTYESTDKATILRCISYRNGEKTSKVYTKTFFVDKEIEDKYTVPVISLVTEGDNLFNSDSGIFVPGINYDSSNPEWSGNYFMKGREWERDVHIEFFNKDGNVAFSQNAGIRIHGGKTRQTAQKSLRLYARNEYGKDYFNYKIFPQKQTDNYKRLILRTTMGSWGKETIIKDVLAHAIARTLNVDYQDFQPAIVYINGEYWGIHTIRDRIDEQFISYTHNIDKDSVEFLEDNISGYNDLMLFVENNDLSVDSNYEFVKTQIEIDNYIDYNIAEQFFANFDWYNNNIKIWREKTNGKWRWVFYDLDAGFGDPNKNMFYHSTVIDTSATYPDSQLSVFLFRNLLKNKEFKNRYINRYAEILNTVFDVDLMKEKYLYLTNLYEPEIENHIKRWNYPESMDIWKDGIDDELLSFLKKRPCIVRKNIVNFFNLSYFGFDCPTNPYDSEDLILAPNPNYGSFFLINHDQDISNGTIEITNINGQSVYSESNISLENEERKSINLSHLPSSTYILHFISEDFVKQYKIVVIN